MHIENYISKNRELVWRIVDDEVVIMDPEGKLLHILNDLGSRIWEISNGQNRVKDIILKICAEYDVQEQRAQVDILEFVEQLVQKGLFILSNNSPEEK